MSGDQTVSDDSAETAVAGDLTEDLIRTSVWDERDLEAAGIPVIEVPFVTVGGGLGSFAMVDFLRSAGVAVGDIRVLGDSLTPTETYEYLATNSQIPRHERLRSDASSVMDNIWGFPSYALREAWAEKSPRRIWQVVTEPVLDEYFTPKAGQVYESVAREAKRIHWNDMVTLGYVRMVRKRHDGGYFVLQTRPEPGATRRVAYRCDFVHLAIGYPGVAFLPDLQEYRERTGDYMRVVNAYEPHDHMYEELLRRPCTVLVRGSGIVGSRILQRLIDDRVGRGAQTKIIHLFRNYVGGPQGERRTFRRPGGNGFAYQGFNFPKAAWGGQLRVDLERLDGEGRAELIREMGGTNTAPRRDWKHQLERGAAEGFYEQIVGSVEHVDQTDGRDAIVTRIRTQDGGSQEIEAQFIIDATGLLARLDEHRLMADLLAHTGAAQNPYGRLDVEPTFEVRGTASGAGAMYASGSMTLGGYYAGVDSFLGLQYAALQIADDLAARGFGKRLGPLRSVTQWMRWMRDRTP